LCRAELLLVGGHNLVAFSGVTLAVFLGANFFGSLLLAEPDFPGFLLIL
jgi:hypothetical protein